VGTEIAKRVSYPVSASDIRKWALAVYWPEQPPIRFQAEGEELCAPEDFNPFAWAVAGRTVHAQTGSLVPNNPDHTELQIGIPGPGLKFQMNGGISTSYGVRIRPGDIITGATRLAPYTERDGKLGHLLISTTEETWTNQCGEFVKRTASTLIRY
jgi:hypothetical protein